MQSPTQMILLLSILAIEFIVFIFRSPIVCRAVMILVEIMQELRLIGRMKKY